VRAANRWFTSSKFSKICWSPLGDLSLVTGSWDDQFSKVCIWNLDLSHGSVLQDPELLDSKTVKGDVTDLQWLSYDDRSYVFASSSSGDLSFFGTQQDKKLEEYGKWSIFEQTGGITCFDVDSERGEIAVGGENGQLTIFHVGSLHSPKPIKQQTYDIGLSLYGVKYLSSHLIVGGHSKLYFWDTRQNTFPIKTLFHQANLLSTIHSVSPHPSQSQFIISTGLSDGTVQIWDTRNEREPIINNKAHESHVWQVSFHETMPSYLLSSDESGCLLLWNLQGEQQFFNAPFSTSQITVSNLLGASQSINSFDINTSLNALVAVADDQSIILKTKLI